MVQRGKPFLEYVNGLPVEAAPDSADTVYLGGATSRRTDADTLASGGTGVGDSPTFTGTVTHDGPRTYLIRSAGGAAYLSMQSDTANYITFEDEIGTDLGYIDVDAGGLFWRFRDKDGDVFFQYDQTTGLVTFPATPLPIQSLPLTVQDLSDLTLRDDPLYNNSGKTRTITSVTLATGAAATSEIDIWKNGTTIFTGGTDRPALSGGTFDSGVPAVTSWADGEYLQLKPVSHSGAVIRGVVQVNFRQAV